jgi:cytoskeletal protein CcmA (bactofilin family)
MKQSKSSPDLIPFPRQKRGSTKNDAEALSVIAAGMRLDGHLQSSGVVKVAGTVHGNVSADSQVLVAKGGRVDGDVHAREAVLDGEVMGSIVAEERVEIQSSAVIQGEIVTPRLMVHEGAVLDVQVAKPKAAIAKRGAA